MNLQTEYSNVMLDYDIIFSINIFSINYIQLDWVYLFANNWFYLIKWTVVLIFEYFAFQEYFVLATLRSDKRLQRAEGHKKACSPPRQGDSLFRRYDQSALHILIAKLLNYEREHIPPKSKLSKFIAVQQHFIIWWLTVIRTLINLCQIICERHWNQYY